MKCLEEYAKADRSSRAAHDRVYSGAETRMATRELFAEADLLRAPRDGRKRELVDGNLIDGEEVVPGFSCRLGDVLGAA